MRFLPHFLFFFYCTKHALVIKCFEEDYFNPYKKGARNMNMTLTEIAKEIGIVKYDAIPEKMFEYYPIPEDRKNELCSMELIERLQERFDFFGEYFEDAKERWAAIEKDELRKTWVDVSSLYMIDNEYEKVTKIPVPEPDGTLAGDLLQLFIHVPSIEAAYDLYLERGFSEEEAKGYMRTYYSNVNHTSKNILGRTTLIAMYFRWLCLYTKARIFRYSGFNFEIHRFSGAYVLKNKETGEVAILSRGSTYHRSGEVLGSAGAEDEEGSYKTTYEETEDAYIGHRSVNCIFQKEAETFPKEKWSMLLKPGNRVIGVHIPKNTDFSNENIDNAFAGAKEIVKKGFGDTNPKMFHCSSWLLSPQLEEIMKPESRILAFGRRFMRYPIKGNGKAVFNFVFPQSFKGPYEDLPEDTSLMRALKAKYIAGEYIYGYSGFIEL